MMRWPLRYQILLPFTLLVLVTVAVVSALDAWASARRQRENVQDQLRQVATTLADSRFPLTDAVLRQTHGLSGAQFAVERDEGQVIAASDDRVRQLPANVREQLPGELTLGAAISVGGERYFHAAVRLPRRLPSDGQRRLHIFYPEQTWLAAWRETVYPPLIIGAAGVLAAALFSAFIAARVSQPISRLRGQVEEIADRKFHSVPEPARNDELRDLARSVNRMAEMLAHYEDEVRRSERLKALGQLRGGLAHQLRNAVTGCHMALELYLRRRAAASTGGPATSGTPGGTGGSSTSENARQGRAGVDAYPTTSAADESLQVAHRQLLLIEKHLEQFLRFGMEAATHTRAPIDLAELATNVLPLVRPAAQHVGVAVELVEKNSPVVVSGDTAALEQMLVNLLLNAVEAVAGQQREQAGRVELTVRRTGELVELCVADNGPGPSDAVKERLFEPLVTGKPEGTGLGLSVAREIARQHDGELRWERVDGWTRFVAALPSL